MEKNVIILDEKTQNILNLMEKSKFIPLKRFAFEINNYKVEIKPICFKNASTYPSMPVTIIETEKKTSHVYKTFVKIKKEDDKTIVSYKNTYDTTTIKEMTLQIFEDHCKFVSKLGRTKEEYTFSFNEKKILNFVDKNEPKEKIL